MIGVGRGRGRGPRWGGVSIGSGQGVYTSKLIVA